MPGLLGFSRTHASLLGALVRGAAKETTVREQDWTRPGLGKRSRGRSTWGPSEGRPGGASQPRPLPELETLAWHTAEQRHRVGQPHSQGPATAWAFGPRGRRMDPTPGGWLVQWSWVGAKERGWARGRQQADASCKRQACAPAKGWEGQHGPPELPWGLGPPLEKASIPPGSPW